MVHKRIQPSDLSKEGRFHSPTFAKRAFREPVPKYDFPDTGLAPQVAYQLCHDELNLDGNPSLNLASFVTTWMEAEAEQLIRENLNKNLVDQEEYPQTKEIERRCVNMLADLFHAPSDGVAVGTSTIGSSEAIMLAALSHKWRWREGRKSQNLAYDRPNMIMGADVQVVWEKFARYFDVEPRVLPMSTDRFILDPNQVAEAVDDNTICVVGILGTTFTGAYEPIKELNDALVKIKKGRGLDIPLHVDAASGGFVAPFAQPKFLWDFRLPQVKSINVSGHKYGLVYPGVGWVLWRDAAELPDDLIFKVNYLGGEMPTFNLNFSRGGSHVIAQYYNFLRLGRSGYQQIIANLMDVRDTLRQQIEVRGVFEILTHAKHSLPVLTMRLKQSEPFSVYDVSELMRERGWIIPAYTMPPNAESIEVLRIVIREGFSRDMADLLMNDLHRGVEKLRGREPKKKPSKRRTGPC